MKNLQVTIKKELFSLVIEQKHQPFCFSIAGHLPSCLGWEDPWRPPEGNTPDTGFGRCLEPIQFEGKGGQEESLARSPKTL